MRVKCPACNRGQTDEGRRNACRYCGTQPVPSYDYPEDSAFHPNHRPKRKASPTKTVEQLYRQLKSRKDKLRGHWKDSHGVVATDRRYVRGDGSD